jgi:quercetin 2,3-dioxygenase
MATAIINKIAKKTTITAQLTQENHGRGFLSANLTLQRFPIDPFIVATDFHMNQPFFPPHPHAGVSVLTYIFEDSQNAFINRDSKGDHSRIEPGGLHLTQAGVGMQHEEIPEKTGIDAHGLQLWVNHSAANRLVEAKAFHAKSKEVPELYPTENSRIRILLGEMDGTKGAIQAVTPVTLLDAHIAAHEPVSLEIPAGFNAWIFVLKGNATLSEGTLVKQYGIAIFELEGTHIELTAGEEGTQFLLGMGKILGEPNAFGGPFVMTTSEQLLETKRRFGRGEMGELAASVKF